MYCIYYYVHKHIQLNDIKIILLQFDILLTFVFTDLTFICWSRTKSTQQYITIIWHDVLYDVLVTAGCQ